ncbi:MAG TPA: DmsC/YnfH family molybdoenzyme membrane anchor subunit [Candidatus Saccharimonadia bacterium]|nr:DmsC/YnfH family molybdoenzyme membrane anchor subunit [Candidatus Saccharimonadia bacterium]
MNPAMSVIAFTTLSGAGLGLLAWLGLHYVRAPLPVSQELVLGAIAIGLVLLAVGLASSMAHLGKPLRAWRAFSQWRSSWLSREGVASVATFVPALVLAFDVWRGEFDAGTRIAAASLLVLALASLACTAKIYDTLKPIAAWHNGYVLPGYVLIGVGTGALWLFALLALSGWQPRPMQLSSMAVVLTAIGVHKLLYWRHVDRTPAAASIGSLTGLGRFGAVTPFEAPHTEANYLLHEMGFVLARRHARSLRRIALVLLAAVPLAILIVLAAAPRIAPVATGVALLAAMLGALVERWLFFAEARHAVVGYYGTRGR